MFASCSTPGRSRRRTARRWPRLPRRPARRLRRRPLDGESFAFLIASDLDDPTDAVQPPRDRRATPAAPDPPAAVRRDDRRSVRAAWRGHRCRLAGRAGRRRRGRLPRGRGRPAADRVGHPGRRHPARSCAVGAAGGVRAHGRRTGSASDCGRSSCARRPRSSSAARRRPAPRGGCCASGATGSTSCRSRHAPGSRHRPTAGDGGQSTPGRLGPSAIGSGSTAAISCSPVGSTRGWTSGRSCRRWPTWRGPAGPTASPRTSRGRRGSSSSGASPDDRASVARAAARKGIGESLVYAPALADRRSWSTSSAARAAAILPVVSEAAGLPVIEALACGIPVVASAVGPLPELIGPAGLLVDPATPIAWPSRWPRSGRTTSVHGSIAEHRARGGAGASRGLGRRRGRDAPASTRRSARA